MLLRPRPRRASGQSATHLLALIAVLAGAVAVVLPVVSEDAGRSAARLWCAVPFVDVDPNVCSEPEDRADVHETGAPSRNDVTQHASPLVPPLPNLSDVALNPPNPAPTQVAWFQHSDELVAPMAVTPGTSIQDFEAQMYEQHGLTPATRQQIADALTDPKLVVGDSDSWTGRVTEIYQSHGNVELARNEGATSSQTDTKPKAKPSTRPNVRPTTKPPIRPTVRWGWLLPLQIAAIELDLVDDPSERDVVHVDGEEIAVREMRVAEKDCLVLNHGAWNVRWVCSAGPDEPFVSDATGRAIAGREDSVADILRTELAQEARHLVENPWWRFGSGDGADAEQGDAVDTAPSKPQLPVDLGGQEISREVLPDGSIRVERRLANGQIIEEIIRPTGVQRRLVSIRSPRHLVAGDDTAPPSTPGRGPPIATVSIPEFAVDHPELQRIKRELDRLARPVPDLDGSGARAKERAETLRVTLATVLSGVHEQLAPLRSEHARGEVREEHWNRVRGLLSKEAVELAAPLLAEAGVRVEPRKRGRVWVLEVVGADGRLGELVELLSEADLPSIDIDFVGTAAAQRRGYHEPGTEPHVGIGEVEISNAVGGDLAETIHEVRHALRRLAAQVSVATHFPGEYRNRQVSEDPVRAADESLRQYETSLDLLAHGLELAEGFPDLESVVPNAPSSPMLTRIARSSYAAERAAELAHQQQSDNESIIELLPPESGWDQRYVTGDEMTVVTPSDNSSYVAYFREEGEPHLTAAIGTSTTDTPSESDQEGWDLELVDIPLVGATGPVEDAFGEIAEMRDRLEAQQELLRDIETQGSAVSAEAGGLVETVKEYRANFAARELLTDPQLARKRADADQPPNPAGGPPTTSPPSIVYQDGRHSVVYRSLDGGSRMEAEVTVFVDPTTGLPAEDGEDGVWRTANVIVENPDGASFEDLNDHNALLQALDWQRGVLQNAWDRRPTPFLEEFQASARDSVEESWDVRVAKALDREGIPSNLDVPYGATTDASIELFGGIVAQDDPRLRLAQYYAAMKDKVGRGRTMENALRAEYLSHDFSIRHDYGRYTEPTTITQLARALTNIDLGRRIPLTSRDVDQYTYQLVQTPRILTSESVRAGDCADVQCCPDCLWQMQLFEEDRYLGRIGFNLHEEHGTVIVSISNVQGAVGVRDDLQRFWDHTGKPFGAILIEEAATRIDGAIDQPLEYRWGVRFTGKVKPYGIYRGAVRAAEVGQPITEYPTARAQLDRVRRRPPVRRR